MASLADALIDIGQAAAARGMMPATSGNLSARDPEGGFLVTASGVDKGDLRRSDLVRVDGDGSAPAGAPRTSAETLLHLVRYAADPEIGAIVHVHAAEAVLVSRRVGDVVRWQGFELQKALAGVRSHEETVELPVFENDQDMGRLAGVVEARLAGRGRCWGYLLRGHGLYAWGRTPAEAWRHTEAWVALLDYAWKEAST